MPATLGNHEFNYGLDFLRLALAAARFPITCANVLITPPDDPARDETLLPPFLILTAGVSRRRRSPTGPAHRRHRIAAAADHGLGRAPTCRGASRPAISSPPPGRACRRCGPRGPTSSSRCAIPGSVRQSRRRDGECRNCPRGPAGYRRDDRRAQPPRISRPRLRRPAGVDGVAGTLCGKPAVMPGCYASHLGVIDLVLEQDGSRMARRPLPVRGAAAFTVCRRPETDPGAEALLAATRAAHEATLAYIRRPVGHSAIPLTTFFAVLPGNAALDLIAQAQAWHVAPRAVRTRLMRRFPCCRPHRRSRWAGAAGQVSTRMSRQARSPCATLPIFTPIPTASVPSSSPGQSCRTGSSGPQACSGQSPPASRTRA